MTRATVVLAALGLVMGLAANLAPRYGGTGQEPRLRVRGRVVRSDGGGWPAARVFLASSLFPNAIGAGINDLVSTQSDERGYFAVDLLADRTYAAWAAQEEPARGDGWRVYRASAVATAGAGRVIRIVECRLRAVRVPVSHEALPAGSMLVAQGLVHPPRQAEAITLQMPLERDDAGRLWTPMWPYGIVALRLLGARGERLADASINASLDNLENLRARDGKADLEVLGRLRLQPAKPAAATLSVTGRLSARGVPVVAPVLVRHVSSSGCEERLVASGPDGRFVLEGVGLPAEVWARRTAGDVPEVAWLATIQRRQDAALGDVELEALQRTLVSVLADDGTPAERAVVVLDTRSQPLGALRTFAGRHGQLRIARPRDAVLEVGARWREGVAWGSLPGRPSVELRGTRSVMISGSVVDGDGNPLPDIEVAWSPPPVAGVDPRVQFLLPDRAWTDHRGRFEAVLPSRDWLFHVRAGRFVRGTVQQALEVVDPAKPEPLRLELQEQ